METILVGYDGTEHAERALERAAELAQGLSARLLVVSVARSPQSPEPIPAIEPPEAIALAMPGPGAAPVPLPVPEQPPEPKELVQHQLERARAALMGRDVEVEYTAEVGDAAERLLAVADARDADLVVVGSREHGFLDRLLGSHVDEALAAHAPRDVLLVR
jgi:nucleotide-binding universal stress UspA family protein